jgi:hypothetical protein
LTSATAPATVKGRSERKHLVRAPDRGTPGPARMPRPSAEAHQRRLRRVPPSRSLKTEQKKPKVRAGDRIPSGVEVVHQVNALRTTIVSCPCASWPSPELTLGGDGRLSVHDRRSASADRGLDGEFDPGSGRTLAACLTHASRTRSNQWQHWGRPSGERVSNT